MKPILATVTGACLLISSAGVVLADNPHNPVTGTGTKGQPGTINGNTCGSIAGSTAQAIPGSGKGVGSPFGLNGGAKRYAGNPGNPTGPGGNANNGTVANNSSYAVSEYDVACFQATQHLP
jgi:hypothetical protein